MKPRCQFARNKLFNFFVLLFLLCGYMGITSFIRHEIGWGIFFSILAVGLFLPGSFFTPYCYRFDDEGVSLRYLVLPEERYLWKNVRAVKVSFGVTFSSRSAVLEPLFDHVFAISGEPEGESRFYMHGRIRMSFRTKRLLERYWGGTITGYLLDDAKKWFHKRREEKDKQIVAHLTDEIVPMERESRRQAREWLVPYTQRADKNGLVLRTEYRYVSNKQVCRSRPKQGYTYTLSLSVSRPNETEETRIFTFDTPLLYVRLGKTAYRGTIAPHVEERLRLNLDVFFENVESKGFDACIST